MDELWYSFHEPLLQKVLAMNYLASMIMNLNIIGVFFYQQIVT